jgi:hypothetical protein
MNGRDEAQSESELAVNAASQTPASTSLRMTRSERRARPVAASGEVAVARFTFVPLVMLSARAVSL